MRTVEEEGGMAFPDDKYYGMTLRDYLAAKAMPEHIRGLASAHWDSEQECADEVARFSYLQADAMLKAREA